MKLNKQVIRNSHYVLDNTSRQYVFHANDPFALMQICGYAKHQLTSSTKKIVFRGQRKLYNGLTPSLFRSITTSATCSKYKGELNKIVANYQKDCSILKQMNNDTIEALLQHYGYNTTWVDVVDNIWVALWFACHRWFPDNRIGTIGHFTQRGTLKSRGKVFNNIAEDPIFDETKFAYVLIIENDDKCDAIDLRTSVPSIFLRPHMQHGLLFRVKGNGPDRPMDYSSQIKGIIRIYLDDALSWLGQGSLVDRDCLFPSPLYDFGYRILLENDKKYQVSKRLGGIQIHSNGKLL